MRTRTVRLALIIILMIMFLIPITSADVEDFTTYNKIGADQAVITLVNATYVGVTVEEIQDEALLYRDLGVGNEITGAFKHTFAFIVTAHDPGDISNRQTANLLMYHASRASDVVQCKSGSNSQWLEVVLKQVADGQPFNLQLNTMDDAADTTVSTLSVGSWYYLNLTRSGTAATLKIYTDETFTTLFDTLYITGANDNYRYLIYAQSVDENTLDPTDDWTGYISNLDLTGSGAGFSSPPYIDGLAETDRMLWTEIRYTSNTTGSHKLEYDLNSGLGSVDGTLWANSTDTPNFFIPQSAYNLNQTLYYRVTVPGGYSETGDFVYTQSPNDAANAYVDFPNLQFVGGTHDPPNATTGRYIWVDPVSGNWITKQGSGDAVTILQSSDRALHWTTIDTLTANTDYPVGWTHTGSWGGFEYDGTYYYLVLEGQDASGKGSFIYRGSSLTSLTYYGRLCYYGSGFTHLTKNCRARDIWHNETDSKIYFMIGGASDTNGAWDYVYKVCDTDGDLTLADETAASSTVLVYDISDWAATAWADAFSYPYGQMIWDWTNARGMGVVPGCGKDTPDYDFDSDLAFPSSPIPTGIAYFYAGNNWLRGYFGSQFDTGQGKSVGMTDIMDTCIIWENDGSMFVKMKESDTSGASDPDAGDAWLGLVRGFFNDTMIGVDPGYARITHYYSIPSYAQFKTQYLGVDLWTTEPVNVTFLHLDGSAPVYGNFYVYKTSTEVNITIKIRNLTTDTCYLHRSGANDYWNYGITTSSIDPLATLTPAGSGNDFMFSFTQEASASAGTPYNDGFWVLDHNAGDNLERNTWYEAAATGGDTNGDQFVNRIDWAVYVAPYWLNLTWTKATDEFTIASGSGLITVDNSHSYSAAIQDSNVKVAVCRFMFLDGVPDASNVDVYQRTQNTASAWATWDEIQSNYFSIGDPVDQVDQGGSGPAPDPAPPDPADPNDPTDEQDTDGDGIPDDQDWDDDNDGIPDTEDPDDDNDGIPDEDEQDTDGDGIPDDQDPDDDGDGIPDDEDFDDDGDGIPDEHEEDTDDDGIRDDWDGDIDGDGIPNHEDPFPYRRAGFIDVETGLTLIQEYGWLILVILFLLIVFLTLTRGTRKKNPFADIFVDFKLATDLMGVTVPPPGVIFMAALHDQIDRGAVAVFQAAIIAITVVVGLSLPLIAKLRFESGTFQERVLITTISILLFAFGGYVASKLLTLGGSVAWKKARERANK